MVNEDFKFLHNSMITDDLSLPPDLDKNNFKILLLDDDETFGKIVIKFLQKKLDIDIIFFNHPNLLLEYVQNNLTLQFCLLTDVSLGKGCTDGIILIDLLKERKLDFFTIVMTGFGTIETAIFATKQGIYHYLTKPFDLKFLLDIIIKGFASTFKMNTEIFISKNKYDQKNMTFEPLRASNDISLESPTANDFFCGMIGKSNNMKSVFHRIKKVANTNSTILINGDSGTGKELVARSIHELSDRSQNNLVCINCGAIPADLLESELFGHVKGAFTGAIADRIGRFEQANGGTIFLDEIGDMPLLLQVKLLRVLQAREIERVGDYKTRKINVRIIAATHRNLENEVKEGRFREDLFYRLNVIPIIVPLLKNRRSDIPLLISYFVDKFASINSKNKIPFSSKTLEILMSYQWPGNVRELENLVERLMILKSSGVILPSDLPSKILAHLPNHTAYFEMESDNVDFIKLSEVGLNLKQTLSEIEESLIKQALQISKGNKKQASKLLHMNRTTLIEKVKKMTSLEDQRF